MGKSRRWTYVAQEAKRLAELGLSAAEISRRIGVNRSSVSRWMKASKLPPASPRVRRQTPGAPGVQVVSTPAGWARAVHDEFHLSCTDVQLVALAEAALGLSCDVKLPVRTRLSAGARFQNLVRQLSLPTRMAKNQEPASPEPPAPKRRLPPRSRTDPRDQLLHFQAPRKDA